MEEPERALEDPGERLARGHSILVGRSQTVLGHLQAPVAELRPDRVVGEPRDLGKLERLNEEVKASSDPGRFVIRLKLQGGTAWSIDEAGRLEALEAALRAVHAGQRPRATSLGVGGVWPRIGCGL